MAGTQFTMSSTKRADVRLSVDAEGGTPMFIMFEDGLAAIWITKECAVELARQLNRTCIILDIKEEEDAAKARLNESRDGAIEERAPAPDHVVTRGDREAAQEAGMGIDTAEAIMGVSH